METTLASRTPIRCKALDLAFIKYNKAHLCYVESDLYTDRRKREVGMSHMSIVRALGYLWQFKTFRYSCFHVPVGFLNYGVAYTLFALYEVDKYSAINTGHLVHVFFGLFYDRTVTFRKVVEDRFWTWVRYWVVEGFSYISIILVVYLLIDVYIISLCGIQVFGYDQCGYEEYWVRCVPAMLVATAISFFGHKYWTFAKANNRIKLA